MTLNMSIEFDADRDQRNYKEMCDLLNLLSQVADDARQPQHVRDWSECVWKQVADLANDLDSDEDEDDNEEEEEEAS